MTSHSFEGTLRGRFKETATKRSASRAAQTLTIFAESAASKEPGRYLMPSKESFADDWVLQSTSLFISTGPSKRGSVALPAEDIVQ